MDRIQGDSGSLEELLNFDFQALNLIQKDFPPNRSFVDQARPQNFNQSRRRYRTRRDKEIHMISPSVSISSEDPEFLDSDDSSQSYQSIVGSKNLSGKNNLGTKNFRNRPDFSKPKSPKLNNFSNSVASSRPVSNHEPKNTGRDRNNKAVLATMLKQLKNEDKEICYYFNRKLKGDMINFKPIYEQNKLYFNCEVCDLYLLPQKVVSHAFSRAHLNFSKHNLSNVKPEGTQKNDSDIELSGIPPAQVESNEIFCDTVKGQNKEDKRIIDSFGEDAVNILNCFQLSEGKGKISYICNVCQLSLFPKYVKSHLYSCANVKDLRKNHSFVNLEDLNHANRNVVKKVIMDVNYKLFVFELFCEKWLNELGFFCNVCCIAVAPMDVKDHINSDAHTENLCTNPFSLEFNSLNKDNRKIVQGVTNVIKDGMKDFNLLYKTGTEEIRFFCKICQMSLWPDKVVDHFKLLTHSNPVSAKHNEDRKVPGKSNSRKQRFDSNCDTTNVTIDPTRPSSSVTPSQSRARTVPGKSNLRQQRSNANCDSADGTTDVTTDPTGPSSSVSRSQSPNWTIIQFNSLNQSQIEEVEKLITQSKIEPNCIDILRGANPKEFYIVCKICNVTFKPALLPAHVEFSDHLNSSEICAIFNNFISLKESDKNILRNLHTTFGSKLNVFSLILASNDKTSKFKCKSCEVTIPLDNMNNDWLANHMDCKNHPVTATKRTSNSYNKPAVNPFSQPKYEAATRKTVENFSPSCSSDGINSSYATSSLYPISSKNTQHKMLETKPSHKSESTAPFSCRDCNNTINFNAENDRGLREKTREELLTNCSGKSVETIVHSRRKREVSNSNASVGAISVLSGVSAVPNDPRKFEAEELCDSDKATLKMRVNQKDNRFKSFNDGNRINKYSHGSDKDLEAHIKYAQVDSVKNSRFKYFDDGNKVNKYSHDFDEDLDLAEAVASGSSGNHWENITESDIFDCSDKTFRGTSSGKSSRASKDSCSVM